uniref:Glycosyl transferase CAP10 domain-containing protein n=1 Tax=Trieres chinensis TaxID=1514140 RepID=A0A7S1ZUA9_TRICV
MAVWRGSMTGLDWMAMEQLPPSEREGLSDQDLCLRYSERCRLVYETNRPGSSGLVNAGMTDLLEGQIPEVINGVNLIKGEMSVAEQMRFKAIISIQGNDVASGLKWSLFSKSVVIMPPPTVTSWAMEELLVPWVHYVPLEDIGKIDERVKWVRDHDEESKRIAERATLWIWDMFFHPDASGDEVEVKAGIVRRYAQYFAEWKDA